MYDTSHYTALYTNLSNEKQRLQAATSEGEKALRSAWVGQLERELAAEVVFLKSKGVNVYSVDIELNDDDLLNELFS